MKDFARTIPEGVKDYSDDLAMLKESVQNKVKNVFRTNSYNLIETPSFEYLDVFTRGEENYQMPSLYHLVNRQGELMSLRNDMTMSIARVVGTSSEKTIYPKRYAYVTNSYRYPKRYQGTLHEFTQAGVELIGVNNSRADAEVIKVAISCLKKIGIDNYVIHIGNSKFLEHVLNDYGLSESCIKKAYQAIEDMDEVTLKKIFNESNMNKESLVLILELVQCAGEINLLRSIKSKVNSKKALDAISEIENIYNILCDYNVGDKIVFDFSLMSYAKYYTGMTFQIFAKGLGDALVEGGRYDSLLKLFGKDLPAVGFGLHINDVLKLFIEQNNCLPKNKPDALVVSSECAKKMYCSVCEMCRDKGLVLESAFSSDIAKETEYAKTKEIENIIYFCAENKIEISNLRKNTKELFGISCAEKASLFIFDYLEENN